MGLDDPASSLQRATLSSHPDPSANRGGGGTDRGLGSMLMNAGMKYASSQKPTSGGPSGYSGSGEAASYYNPGGGQSQSRSSVLPRWRREGRWS